MRKPLLVLSLVGLLTAAFVAPAAAARPDGAGRPTLASVAIGINAQSGEFSTLLAAVTACDLVGALSGKTQLTVFAPTDAAFAELGIDASTFAAGCPDGITEILLYHVAPGRWSAGRLIDAAGGVVPTLNGDTLSVSLADGSVFVDASRVIIANVNSSNGFIHAIDSVLLPAS
jgi:uncharacterized surface protein with fasciclin (FAS1) repeats